MHYNSTTNVKIITRAKTDGKRRTKILKREGGKIDKNWKIHVIRRTGD